GKAGLARVVIRTREYLALVRPEGPALLLLLLRYPQELVDADEYSFPEGTLRSYKLAPRELEMANELVASMATTWTPDGYRDEFRERLLSVMKARMRKGKGKAATADVEDAEPATEVTGNVVDFMALLKKSIAEKRRSPAKKSAAAKSKPKSRSRATAKSAGSRSKRRRSASR